ncbi:hypothetical protein, partial [Staphylococcus aureus]
MIKCQFYDIYLLKIRTNERYDNIDVSYTQLT